MSATNATPNCPHCGFLHPRQPCPRVKAIEYYPDGTVKRVEYVTPEPVKAVDGPNTSYTYGYGGRGYDI